MSTVKSLLDCSVLFLVIVITLGTGGLARAGVNGDVYETTSEDCDGPPTLSEGECNGIDDPVGCEIDVTGDLELEIGESDTYTIDLDNVAYFDPTKLTVVVSPGSGSVISVSPVVDCKFDVTGVRTGVAIVHVEYNNPARGEFCQWVECVEVNSPPDPILTMSNDHYIVYQRNLPPEEQDPATISVDVQRLADADDSVRISVNNELVSVWTTDKAGVFGTTLLDQDTFYPLLSTFHKGEAQWLNICDYPTNSKECFTFQVRPEMISLSNMDTTVTVEYGRTYSYTDEALQPQTHTCLNTATIDLTVVAVDVDVDSNNMGGIESESATNPFDTQEDVDEALSGVPGQFVQISNEDADGDGIPNFADGYNFIETSDFAYLSSTHTFTPISVKLSQGFDPSSTIIVFRYSYSDPGAITVPEPPEEGEELMPDANDAEIADPGIAPAGGLMRIWTFPTNRNLDDRELAGDMNGDQFTAPPYSCYDIGTFSNIQPNVRYRWGDLAGGSRSYTFPLEVIRPAANFFDRSASNPNVYITVDVFPNENLAQCVEEYEEPDDNGPQNWDCSDEVKVFPAVLDIDSDSNNTWKRVDQASQPKYTFAEESAEDQSPGTAVGIAAYYDTSDPVGETPDLERETLSDSESARLAIMGIARFTLSQDPTQFHYVLDLPGDETSESNVRVWQRRGGAYYIVPAGQLRKSGASAFYSVGDTVELYIEGLDASAGTAGSITVNVLYDPANLPDPESTDGSGPGENAILVATDTIKVTPFPVPTPVAYSEFFTPRMVEAPPYNVAKVDATFSAVSSSYLSLSLMVYNDDASDYTDPEKLLYRWDIDPSNDLKDDKTHIYDGRSYYEVDASQWYNSSNRVEVPSGDPVYRFVWDGRQHSMAYLRPDLELDPEDYAPDKHLDTQKPVWAKQPETIEGAGSIAFPALPVSLVNHRPLGRLKVYTKDGGDFEVKLKTSPMPTTGSGRAPIWGEAPYWPTDHGVNPFTRALTQSRTLGPMGGIGPIPTFTYYFNGNSWRHSTLGFGFTHNYDMRIVEVYHHDGIGGRIDVNDYPEDGADTGHRLNTGSRHLYLMLNGDHLLQIHSDEATLNADSGTIYAAAAPSFFDPLKSEINEDERIGYVYIFGELAHVYELPIDDDTGVSEGWRLETRGRTLYSFNYTGQLTKVEDRNGNTLTLNYEQLDEEEDGSLFHYLKEVTNNTGSVKLSFEYYGSGSTTQHSKYKLRNVQFTKTGVATKAYIFDYYPLPNFPQYQAEMAPAELLHTINDPEHDFVYEWNNIRRHSPASRILVNSLAKMRIKEKSSSPDIEDQPDSAVIVYSHGSDPNTGNAALIIDEPVTGTQIGESQVGHWRDVTVSESNNNTVITTGDQNDITRTYTYAGYGTIDQVTTQHSSGSATRMFHYDEQLRLRTQDLGAINSSETNDYDVDGNVISTDQDGFGEVTYIYNGNRFNVPKEILRPLQRRTTYELDNRGNVVTITQHGDAQAPTRSSTYIRNANGTVDTLTDPDLRVTSYVYTPEGILKRQTRGTGANAQNLLDQDIDAYGRVLVDRDPKAQATAYQYDLWDRVRATTTRDNEMVIVEGYTGLSQPLELVSSLAGSATSTTVYRYGDSALAFSSIPLGYTVSGTNPGNFAYNHTLEVDSEGNVRSHSVTPGPEGNGAYTTTCTYDYYNRLTAQKANDVPVFSREFDGAGNLTKSVDGKGAMVEVKNYAGVGLPGLVVRPTGNGSVTYHYDDLGNLVQTDDNNANGQTAVTNYDVDLFDRTYNINDPLGEDWAIELNSINQVTHATDPRNNTTAFGYHPTRGYLTSGTLPDSSTFSMEVDNNGNVTKYTDPRGHDFGMGWDAQDHLNAYNPPLDASSTFTNNSFGSPISGSVMGRSFSNKQDAANRTVEASRPGNMSAAQDTVAYDPAGATEIKDRTNLPVTVKRDAGGKTEEVTVNDTITHKVKLDANYNLDNTSLEAKPDDGNYINRNRTVIRDAMQRVTDVINNSGAEYSTLYDGWGIPRTGVDEQTGHYNLNTNILGQLVSLTVGNYILTVDEYDEAHNLKRYTPPGKSTVVLGYNSRNNVNSRTTPISATQTRTEIFGRDPNQNVTSQTISGLGTSSFMFDMQNRVKEFTNRDGVVRAFNYTSKAELQSDSSGSLSTALTYDGEGRLKTLSVTNQPSHSFNYDAASRLEEVWRGGVQIYDYEYDPVAKRLARIQDEASNLGGSIVMDLSPDFIGYAWKRSVYADGEQIYGLEEPINDVGTLTGSDLTVGGLNRHIGIMLENGTRISNIIRPGPAPTTTYIYNANREITNIDHGPEFGSSIIVSRNPTDGRVDGRTLPYVGVSETFGYNQVHWLTRETRNGEETTYNYREDGTRTTQTIDSQLVTFTNTAHGSIAAVDNLRYGAKIRAPYEGRVWEFDDVITTVDQMMHRIFFEFGTAAFTEPQVILLPPGAYTADMYIGATGCFDDDFNGGDAAFWSQQVASGNGTIDLQQTTRKQGQLGYAPRFTANNANYAYLRKDFVNLDSGGGGGGGGNGNGGGGGKGGVRWHPAPDDLSTALPTLTESFWLYIESTDINHANDVASVFRGYTTLGVMVDVYLTQVNGQLVLKVDYLTGGHQGQPTVVAAGSVPITVGEWHEFAFVYYLDRIAGAGQGDGSFRWWYDGQIRHTSPPLDVKDDTRFISLDLGLTAVSSNTSSIIIDDLGTGGLHPTAANPLIIRNYTDRVTNVTGAIDWCRQSYVRLQGLHLDGAITACDQLGGAIASCAIRSDVSFSYTDQALLAYNTFDYQDGLASLSISDTSATNICNNIFANPATSLGWTQSNDTGLVSDYNVYLLDPADPNYVIATEEPHSTVGDPAWITGTYVTNLKTAPQVFAAKTITGYDADLRGWLRHTSTPSIGATEYQQEVVFREQADGRVTTRTINGRVYRYVYDGMGRLAAYIDESDSTRNAAYTYDHAGRRVEMVVGDGTTKETHYRFVYDGADVCMEFIKYGSAGGAPDRARIYWLLQSMDQRLGFLDLQLSPSGAVLASQAYYYLTDQVGSVLAIVDEAGNRVNQYVYDAFGNPLPELTYEGIDNRYQFQGREYDAHRGDYYFRMRTYVPEWGRFTGPDMRLELEANGPANYLFADNNPLQMVDPTGLDNLVYSFNGVEKSIYLPSHISGRPDLCPEVLAESLYVPIEEAEAMYDAMMNEYNVDGHQAIAQVATALIAVAKPSPEDAWTGCQLWGLAFTADDIDMLQRGGLASTGTGLVIFGVLDIIDWVPDPTDLIQKGASASARNTLENLPRGYGRVGPNGSSTAATYMGMDQSRHLDEAFESWPTETMATAPKNAGQKLLPGEGNVGTYDDLIAAGSKGDNITPHHIPSANHMKQHGVSKGDGISINMEHPHPGSGGRHRQTFTHSTKADVDLSPRDALGRGVRDARRIYQEQGLYGPDIRAKLQELIRQNKQANPGLFDK